MGAHLELTRCDRRQRQRCIRDSQLGEAFRAVYTGRRMKSGIGFALATVIMDRFLDVWFVAFGFIAFRLLGLGGAPVDGAARYYLVFSLLLVLGLVLVVALRDFLKKICLAFCGLFNDTLKLDGMMFFWSLINTFKDLGRVKIGRLVVNTLLMWAAYLGLSLIHISEPTRLGMISYAVFCLKKKKSRTTLR